MIFEHHKQDLLPLKKFWLRLGLYIIFWLIILAFSLLIGMIGYHNLENLNWIDSFLESSMILGGMGPVATLHNDSAKLFASFYALFSGIVFLVSASVLISPILHRLLHHFHLKK